MNVKSVEKLEKSTVALTIEAGAEELEAAVQKVYLKRRGKIMIPGFRKGRAPRKIIETMYGAEVFYADAVDDIYPGLLDQAVEQEKLDVVAYPHVEMVGKVTKDGFTFKAIVAVQPEVTLGEYKGLTAPKDVKEVTPEDIDHELKPYITRATQMVDVDRAAQTGDTVNIDYEGFIDGEAFEGGQDTEHDLELGSGAFISGFEDQLTGVKAGEEKDVEVTFPEDYAAKDLAGKKAVFKVKVHAVKEKQTPELDDEFAKDVSEFETLEAFREDLGKKLAERRENQARSAFEEALLDQAVGNMTADIPDAMVEIRAQRMLDDYARRLKNQGIELEQYMRFTGTTANMLQKEAMEGALRQVRLELLLKAIAKAEDISASDEELEEECKKLGEQYGMDAAKVREIVPESQIRSDIINQKAANVVFDSAKVGPAPVQQVEEGQAQEEGDAAQQDEAEAPAEE